MREIDQWLERLGLGKYAEIFAENAIGADVLPHLTEEHLKELGLPLGDRLRILKALESARDTSAEVPRTASTTDNVDRASPDSDEAERRQLTVMFCDLMESTALSRRLDPEDLREVNRAYQDAAKAAVERYNGVIARYMGDGVLAYFGYPRAHEDDAERAVRAGLDVVAGIERLNADGVGTKGVELGVRIGIATGPVVVGDLIGEGISQESAVVGETPNLAAKLQGFAERNSVAVGPVTRRLTEGRFDYRDMGERHVKGLPEPVPVARVVGESVASSRFEAVRGRYLAPLVGRGEEIDLLLRRWQRARAGEGQVVLLSGEPGIGKSRLIEAFRSRLAADSYIRLGYQCSPYHSNSALYPIVAQLERAAELGTGQSAEEKLERLEMLLRRSSCDLERDVPLFATLLSLPTSERYEEVEPDVKRRREQTLYALVRQLEGLCRENPVLCIFEDVQWLDPSTNELLDQIVYRVESLPVLVIVACRPEFDAPWIGQAHVSVLMLSRIDRRLSRKLIEDLAGALAMPAAVVDEVLDRTDGVPLFIEELTHAVLESEQNVGAFARRSGGADWKPSIPTTLQDSLMARLDQLTSGKPIAQIASVIGREIDYDVLSEICDVPPSKLEEGLRDLETAGIVFRRDTGAKSAYWFKHALIQDAAYESLLRDRKRELHARVARAIAEVHPDVASTAPELIAHHFTEAGEVEPAVQCWYRAGRRATERSAHIETIAHLTKSLRLVGSISDSEKREAEELRVLNRLGPALMNTQGSASDDVRKTYQRAIELSDRAGDAEQKFIASWGLWINRQMGGDFKSAQGLADELVVLARNLPDSTYLLQAHHAAWTTRGYLGELDAALAHVDRGLDIYDVDRHPGSAYIYGDHDAGVCGYIHKALSLCLAGYPDQALQASKEALSLGDTISHPLSQALASCYAAVIHQLRGEAESVFRLAEQSAHHCAEHGLTIWRNNTEILLGWASAALGDASGVERMRDAVEERTAKGTRLRQVYYLGIFAELLVKAGRVDAALRTIEDALGMLEQSNELRWKPLVLRVHGDLLGKLDRARDAESRLVAAIEVARGQRSSYLELRAAISLATLYEGQGRIGEARNLLEPVYANFEEGFETANFRAAGALLERLS